VEARAEVQTETDVGNIDGSTQGMEEVPAKKLRQPKKRLHITDDNDMDDSDVTKPGHTAGHNNEGDGDVEGLSEAELRRHEHE
jgi:hypothetical protein